MSKLKIRKIESEDIVDILHIAQECRLSHWSRGDYLDEAARTDSFMLLLESDGQRTIGFMVGRRVLSADEDTGFDAEIYNIGITVEFQKSGCGTMLMQEFLRRCRKSLAKNVWLDVRRSNARAISFYKGHGFTEFASRKGFYSDPVEDGIVMKLTL